METSINLLGISGNCYIASFNECFFDCDLWPVTCDLWPVTCDLWQKPAEVALNRPREHRDIKITQ